METYQPLFDISVNHLFFVDGAWKGLDFIIEPGLSRLVAAANILLLPTKSGVSLFYDTSKTEVLQRYADDNNGQLKFGFKVYALDRMFENFTVPSMRGKNALLCFDNSEMLERDETGAIRLSKVEFVSEEDSVELETLFIENRLDEKQRQILPDFIVDIRVHPRDEHGLEPKKYGLKFNTRSSFWKYYLLGNMNRQDSFIVDLDNKVEFEFCGDALLPGNRQSKVFRSKAQIPVLENPEFRFQLREHGQGGGKVLIKRLPLATESAIGFDWVNGKREIVAESYINY